MARIVPRHATRTTAGCYALVCQQHVNYMMVSWHGNIFRFTGPSLLESICSCSCNSSAPRQKGRQFRSDVFKCIFVNENVWIVLKMSLLTFASEVRIDNITALVHIMAWRRLGDHYLKQWWLAYGHIYASLGLNGLTKTNDKQLWCMMTSSNGKLFRVTGPLCGEFTGPRWIPHTKASDAELWCFLWSVPG